MNIVVSFANNIDLATFKFSLRLFVYMWRSREYMYLWVTVDIVGPLYFSHRVWPVRLLG